MINYTWNKHSHACVFARIAFRLDQHLCTLAPTGQRERAYGRWTKGQKIVFVLFKLKLEIVIQNDVKQSHIASQPYTTDKTLVPQARSGCLIQTYSFRRCINSSETRWSGNNCKHLFTHQRWDILEYKRTGHKCNRKSLIFQKRIRLCLQTSHPADSLTTCRRLFALFVLFTR